MAKKRNPSFWKRMHLVDRCLLLFMLLLISQSVYNLFAHEIAYEDASSLDSALRTTTSGIFGYFISGGTMSSSKRKEDEEEESQDSSPPISIGFQATPSSTAIMTAATDNPSTPSIPSTTSTPSPVISSPTKVTAKSAPSNPLGQQVIIVTLIGLISLTILLVARNFAVLNTTTIATLSQFRDFTSGSVGFLIGRANGDQP